MAINPSLYKKLPYDPEKDLVPVVMFYHTPFYVAVSSSGKYRAVAVVEARIDRVGVALIGRTREIGAAVDVVSRAEASARAAQAAVRGTAKADADFVVERVMRLGEICRNGETMLDMLLGQLTLDVARFRDVLKVTPRNAPVAEPAHAPAQRRRR